MWNMINLVAKNWRMMKELIMYYANPIFRKAKVKNPWTNINCFGEKNSDKIIYFITNRSSSGSGIFSMYIKILEDISFAKSMGWIPVIDDTPQLLRRTKVSYRKNRNVMNTYFDFANQISTQEAMKSKQVVISGIANKIIYGKEYKKRINSNYIARRQANFFDVDKSELEYWRNFARHNLKYRDNVQKILEKQYLSVIGHRQNILGVALREGKMGMSSLGRMSSGESKQCSIQEMINIAQEHLEKWRCEYIYLSCESDKAIKLFENYFGNEKVLYLERIRLDYEYLTSVKTMRDGIKSSKDPDIVKNYKERDLDYIKDMFILSKCDYCILPINCGTEVAFLKNENLKDYYIVR